jgi:hypothetical protein
VLGGIGYRAPEGLSGGLDAAVTFRVWTARSQSIVTGVNGSYDTFVRTSSRQTGIDRSFGREALLGYWWTIGDIVTLHLAVDAVIDEPVSHPVGQPPGSACLDVRVGSLQSLASRTLPLDEIHLLRQLSLELNATWGFNLTTGAFHDPFLGGFTWAF